MIYWGSGLLCGVHQGTDFEACQAVVLARRDFKTEAVEGEDLADCRDHLRLVDDQSGDRVGLFIGQ